MRKFLSALVLSSALVGAAPAMAQVAYTNGPINGTITANTINYGWEVTDSFTLSQATTITGFDFGGWTYPGQVGTQVDYGFSTAADFATTGTASLTRTFFGKNFYYDVNTYHATIAPVTLAAGNYWFSLQNAVTSQGDPMYWDQNGGPSTSVQFNSSWGTFYPSSHAFTLYGSPAPAPEPASWAMMLGGFGLVGGAMRARRKAQVSFA